MVPRYNFNELISMPPFHNAILLLNKIVQVNVLQLKHTCGLNISKVPHPGGTPKKEFLIQISALRPFLFYIP